MAVSGFMRTLAVVIVLPFLGSCTVNPPEPRSRSVSHLSTKEPAPQVVAQQAAIPLPVSRSSYLPPPGASDPEETYTVVVNDVPARELLFALARDASINVDVHPEIEGSVTLNAIDQSLFQILDRVGSQLNTRYSQQGDTIAIVPDTPFLRSYKVDYVNVTRNSTGSISASTLVASATGTGDEGGGGNDDVNASVGTITHTIDNQFWETLESSLDEMVRPQSGESSQKRVILNREVGVVLVRATSTQHRLVRRYIDSVMTSSTRQVLIEATIVEVQLNDRYQAGVDWTIFTRGGGLTGAGLALGTDVANAFVPGVSGLVSGLIFDASNAPDGSEKRTVEVSVSLLNEFGDTQVLSSPKVMTLNNQPAVLKVVDNEVYFDIDLNIIDGTSNNPPRTEVQSDIRTVAVGIVMSVTPQIAANDTVTLNVRPTITRIRDFVDDPATALLRTDFEVTNQIPVISVRETETVMRVGSGQLAVLGGLMQDVESKDDESVPGFSELPLAGDLFKFKDRQQTKTELVVFLRPTVIRSPDVRTELAEFQPYLPENIEGFDQQKVPFEPVKELRQ